MACQEGKLVVSWGRRSDSGRLMPAAASNETGRRHDVSSTTPSSQLSVSGWILLCCCTYCTAHDHPATVYSGLDSLRRIYIVELASTTLTVQRHKANTEPIILHDYCPAPQCLQATNSTRPLEPLVFPRATTIGGIWTPSRANRRHQDSSKWMMAHGSAPLTLLLFPTGS